MKRSEINKLIEDAKQLFHKNNITLPPFAYWSSDDWKNKGSECNEIRDCMLGWDITDFGRGDFDKVGLVIFTLRNGHPSLEKYKNKTYCEKLIVMKRGQICPMHYHLFKSEDIINRAGGNTVIQLYNKTEDNQLDTKSDVEVSLDGVKKVLPAGSKVILKPGESITLVNYMYHEFSVADGSNIAILGEVSKVNDDNTDNYFLEPTGRFPEIEEECMPNHYLCTEYPR